jgi:hypothetical protein
MDSGKMLRGMRASYSKTKYIITLTDHSYVGQLHQNGIGVPKREWFGSDAKMRKQQKRELQKAFNKEMKI